MSHAADSDAAPRSEPGAVPPGGARGSTAGIVMLLVAVVFGVFGRTLSHGFLNYDDDEYVYENELVRGGLSLEGVAEAFQGAHSFTWHPLTTLSHMLDCELFGLEPSWHHLVNILLHALNAVLVFLVLRSLTGSFGVSAVVAFVFAIHPLRVESVAWISERKDLTSGLFFLLTLGAYGAFARARQGGAGFPVGRYATVLICFVLALLSKPMVVTLPFVLLLLDAWPLGRWRASERMSVVRQAGPLLLEKLPLFALAAAASAITLATQKGAMTSTATLGLAERIANAVVTYGVYLRQLVWPADLALVVPYAAPTTAAIVVSTLVLVALSVLAVALRKRYPSLLVGWLWYLGMLVPVIGLVQVGIQAHADRYTYLPHIGLLLGVVQALSVALRAKPARLRFAPLAALGAVLALGVTAWFQVAHWRTNETLWRHVLAHTENNSVAHGQLGVVLERSGRAAEAVEHYREAIAIQPDAATPHYNLGNVLAGSGDLDGAIEHYRAALAARPGYVIAANNLGAVLTQSGRTEEALLAFALAVEADPLHVKARLNQAAALTAAGRSDEALATLRAALVLTPEVAELHENLGIELGKRERLDEALVHLRRAIELEPNSAYRHGNLALALSQTGDLTGARAAYERAIALADEGGDTRLARNLRTRVENLEGAGVGR